MALFIQRGYLSRHIAKAHRSYSRKHKFLKELILGRLSDNWSISGDTTGMHLVLNRGVKAGQPGEIRRIIEQLKKRGMLLKSAASYSRSRSLHYENSILISFGKRNMEELERLVNAIAEVERFA